jgi:hypothetical protein
MGWTVRRNHAPSARMTLLGRSLRRILSMMAQLVRIKTRSIPADLPAILALLCSSDWSSSACKNARYKLTQDCTSTAIIPPHQYDTRETRFNNFDAREVFSQKNNG